MTRSTCFLGFLAVLTSGAVTAALAQDSGGDPKAGQLAFNNNCRTCHVTKEGDNRLGPSLHNIVGSKAGTREGYANYSGAMKSSGVVWNEKTLDRFIENPESVVRNNNMKPYKGIPDPKIRQNIIAYLKSQSAGSGASSKAGES
ncbi:MAG: c-type cytochrome [Steroidobacteraceae bacterium]|nr:c-type cytochrome [Steroidobacteraceae bacterium]